MKKTLSLVIAFSLILGLGMFAQAEDVVVSTDQVTVNTTSEAVVVSTDSVVVNTTEDDDKDDDLEKIPNPAEIKNFGQIVKKGTSLWGVRKKEMKQEQKKKSFEEKKGETLEKIPTPSEIKNFKNIKKVGTALWGIRKEAKKMEMKKEQKKQEMKKIDASMVPCVTDAINTKDVALKTAFGTYSEKMNLLLDTRNACQIAALASEDQISASKACAETYQKEVKANNELIKKVRSESWKTYTVKLGECVKTQTTASSTPTVLNLEDGGNVDDSAQL